MPPRGESFKVEWVIRILALVPVDANVDEAQDVAEQDRRERQQRRQRVAVGYFQFQHQDGDDYRDDAIAECSSLPLPIGNPI
jgi:hypothetical protein